MLLKDAKENFTSEFKINLPNKNRMELTTVNTKLQLCEKHVPTI